MALIEIWATLSAVLFTSLIAHNAWLVKKTFTQDSKIAVLENSMDAVKEDISEIKSNISDIHNKIMHGN